MQVGALRAAVCNGVYTRSRAIADGYDVPDECPACGAHGDTPHHRVYGCPHTEEAVLRCVPRWVYDEGRRASPCEKNGSPLPSPIQGTTGPDHPPGSMASGFILVVLMVIISVLVPLMLLTMTITIGTLPLLTEARAKGWEDSSTAMAHVGPTRSEALSVRPSPSLRPTTRAASSRPSIFPSPELSLNLHRPVSM